MTLPDAAAIQRVARRVLAAPDAVIEGHTVSPIDYDAYRPGRAVSRVESRAAIAGRQITWSAIRKRTEARADTPAAPLEGARREALAYRSGVAHASDGVRMPNAFAIDIHDGGPSGDGSRTSVPTRNGGRSRRTPRRLARSGASTGHGSFAASRTTIGS